jgi:uncharacterized NAD(P)/FAD-binding protein YdhS
MSANPADPLEFLRFMQRRQPDTDAESFLPRAWYGDYLEESLQAASLSAPPHIRLDVIRASVTSIRRNRRDLPLRLQLDEATELYGDTVVLAVGNPPPRRLAVAQALAGHPAYVEDPWTLSATTGAGNRLFLIGTGLTMVDVVLAAAARADGAHIQALSRHGLIASRQAAFRPGTLSGNREAVMLAAAPSPRRMLRAVRDLAQIAEAEGGDWREAINFVRGVAPTLWQRMSEADRSQFLRHARPYWDVHRHRLPEAALARLTHLRQTGRLQVHAGRLESLQLEATGVAVRWRPRGRGPARIPSSTASSTCTVPTTTSARTRDRCCAPWYAMALRCPIHWARASYRPQWRGDRRRGLAGHESALPGADAARGSLGGDGGSKSWPGTPASSRLPSLGGEFGGRVPGRHHRGRP